MKYPLPILDETRCTQCGDCVVICPTNCLELLEDGPWLPRPLDCLGCSACVLLCLPEALTLSS